MLESPAKSPPRLILVKHNTQDLPSEGFIVADGVSITVNGCPQDMIQMLLACYYVWDLSFPKEYQVLAFFQVYLLEDLKNKIHRGIAFAKFEHFFLKL